MLHLDASCKGPCFIHEARPGRVIFGLGRPQRSRRGIGAARRRAGDDHHDAVAGRYRRRVCAAHSRACRDCLSRGAAATRRSNVTEAALTAASSVKADGLLVIGGGTAIGLSKAISLRTNLPADRRSRRHSPASKMRHSSARRSAARGSTGVVRGHPAENDDLRSGAGRAFAAIGRRTLGDECDGQCLDALCAPNASPMDALAAAEAMRAISAALPRLLANSGDDAAWSDALYGAWLAGVGVSSSTSIRKLCQTLADTFGLVHAEVDCLMLPYTAAYRRDVAPEAMRRGGRGAADRRRAGGALRSDAARRHARRA